LSKSPISPKRIWSEFQLVTRLIWGKSSNTFSFTFSPNH